MTRKSGLADSPLFHTTPLSPHDDTLPEVSAPLSDKKSKPPSSRGKNKEEAIVNNTDVQYPEEKSMSDRDTTIPRHHGATEPAMVSRYHDTVVEAVRRAVKEFGKEAATHRFTEEEKKAIADILYGYKSQGIRTSENEVTRIAVNFIIGDYRENGENSILDRVLKALNE